MKVTRLLSWPVMVVAVLALALGSVGTATASGLTKHAVKKIAAHVVKKAAPTLSVAHATTADSATTAATATTATHATTADNASNLGGSPPAAFQSRTAFAAGVDVATDGTDPVSVIGPVSLTVPPGQHFVHLTSTAQYYANDFSSTGDVVEYWAVDADCTDTTGYDTSPVYDEVGDNATNTPQAAVVMDYTFNLAPGAHTFTVCGLSDPNIVVGNSTLNLQTVNLNGTGGSTRPATQGAASHTTVRTHR